MAAAGRSPVAPWLRIARPTQAAPAHTMQQPLEAPTLAQSICRRAMLGAVCFSATKRSFLRHGSGICMEVFTSRLARRANDVAVHRYSRNPLRCSTLRDKIDNGETVLPPCAARFVRFEATKMRIWQRFVSGTEYALERLLCGEDAFGAR